MTSNTENSVPAGDSAYEVSQGGHSGVPSLLPASVPSNNNVGKDTPVSVQLVRAENGECVWCGGDTWGAPKGWEGHNHAMCEVPEEVEDGYVCCLCFQKERGWCPEKWKYGPKEDEEEDSDSDDDGFEDCDCGYTHHYEDKCPVGKQCEKYEKWREDEDEDGPDWEPCKHKWSEGDRTKTHWLTGGCPECGEGDDDYKDE